MTADERLIRAWIRWWESPGSRDAAVEKHAALRELGLDSNRTHEAIGAECRRLWQKPAEWTLAGVVQTAINGDAIDRQLPDLGTGAAPTGAPQPPRTVGGSNRGDTA